MRIRNPVLYSFRRCPYAMRARMALHAAGIVCEHREVALRDKPPQMLEASAKGTVPVLVLHDGQVIDESLDIMRWALGRSDPDGWLTPHSVREDIIAGLIADNDGPFKQDLDRFKYPTRYENVDPDIHRERGLGFLARLETRLSQHPQLCGERICLADIAIFPFIRQFANTDRDWFAGLPLPALKTWLNGHVNSDLFAAIMEKHPTWDFRAPVD